MKISRDINGNKILRIERIDIKTGVGFSIQTLGNLPETHMNGICASTKGEVINFINAHGTKRQKTIINEELI